MKKKGKKGITLVELIISVSIFSFVMVTIFSVYTFSVINTYNQTRTNVAHINDVSELEVKSSKYTNLSAGYSSLDGMLYSEAKEVELFKETNSRRIVSAQYLSNYSENTEFSSENIVKIIPIDKLDYNDGVLGRLGPKFITPLLPQEASSINSKYDWQEEDRYIMASYYMDDNTKYGEIGNFRSVKFDLKRHALPRGKYKFKYYVFSTADYNNKVGKADFKKEEALSFKSGEKEPMIKKIGLELNIGNEENVYAHSTNHSYLNSNKITNNDNLKMPITKGAEKVNAWEFLNKTERDKIFPAGKYVFVFELYLDKIEGMSESEAVARLKRFAHLSNIKKVSEVDKSKKLILRDLFMMESVEPNFVVNAGKDLYIGSEFEDNKYSKIPLNTASTNYQCYNFGNLQNAKYSEYGKRFDIDNRSLLVHSGGSSNIYELDSKDIMKVNGKPNTINTKVKNISYSMSPHKMGRVVSYVVEKNNNLWHVDERYHLENQFITDVNAWTKKKTFYLKNNRLFGSVSLNVALLDNGELILTDEWYHKWGKNARDYENYGGNYQDLFIDLLYDYNDIHSKRFLGMYENKFKLIEPKTIADKGCDISEVRYTYQKFKDAKKQEKIDVPYDTAIAGDLREYKFIKFYPLSFYEYLIVAEKPYKGKRYGKILMLSKNYDDADNALYTLSETNYPDLNPDWGSHSAYPNLGRLSYNMERLNFVRGNDSLYVYIDDDNLGKKLYKVNEDYYDNMSHKIVTTDCEEVLTTDSKIMNVYFSNQNE